MASVGKSVGKRAAKATARHTWHGVTSKAKRQPLRSTTLFAVGGAVGLVAGWVAGRRTARPPRGDSTGTP